LKKKNSIILKLMGFLSKPLYRIYEKWLWLQIKDGPLPNHVGIIPDGNRRWARKAGLSINEGHLHGYENIKKTLRMIWELGIKYVTVYAMSTENCLYRNEDERRELFNLARKGLTELLQMKDIYEKKVRVKIIGKLELVPPDIVMLAKEVEEKTKHHDKFFLNIALCYGGRQEIINAVKKLAKDVEKGIVMADDIDETLFSKYLDTGDLPDVDLIIRTSGEERISNFLLWRSAYSELYFCDTLWPDFRKIDFWRAIRSYQTRERRLGR